MRIALAAGWCAALTLAGAACVHTAAAATPEAASQVLAWLGPVAVAAAFGFALWAWLERRRIRTLTTDILRRVPGGPRPQLSPSPLEALRGLDAVLQHTQQQARQEAAERSKAQAALRETQERYRLAVRGASDGLWEWNFKTRTGYFSSRAKSMLGYTDEELGDTVHQWRALIHPDDLKPALTELSRHVEGRTDRYEFEHRMRHKDGSWCWVLARAAVVRHANGKPERLIGLYTDVTARKRVQQLVLDLAEGLSSLQGEACFRTLVRSFAEVMGVREAFVCECTDHPTTRVRMLARWNGADFDRCVEFDLAGTACEEVVTNGRTVFCSTAAGERWPAERIFKREGYLGLPCFDTQGRVIGHIACADPQSVPELPEQAILKIFAVRAGLEIERRQLERERRAVGMRSAPAQIALH